MLVERRLIAKEEGSNNVYKTTERGMQFLKLYKQLEGFVPDLITKPGSIPTTPSGSPG
jgi:predicted transcriptional regulator